MSRALVLDFTAAPGRPAVWSWLLLVLGLALAGWSAQAYVRARDDQAAAQARLDGLRQVARPKPAKPARPDPKAQSRRQLETAARRQLELPWNDLLQTLQRTRARDVALLSLEADGRRGDFQLDAEAKGHAVMLDYLRRLQQQRELRGVALTQHQGVDSDGARVIRFTLRGAWAWP